MNILSWNIRGMNDPNKVVAVRRICRHNNIGLMSILETKIKYNKMLSVQKKLGAQWHWVCNYVHSPRGRIWVGWNENVVSVQVEQIHEQ